MDDFNLVYLGEVHVNLIFNLKFVNFFFGLKLIFVCFRSKPTLKRKQIKDLNNKRNFILENVKPKKVKKVSYKLICEAISNCLGLLIKIKCHKFFTQDMLQDRIYHFGC